MNSFRLSVFLLLMCGAPGFISAQSLNMRLAASAGYDDDVLGRPGDLHSLASTGGEGFLQLSPSVEASARRGSWLLSGAYRYTFNGYGSDAAGLYHDHLGWVTVGYQPASRLTIFAEGSGERFRRTQYKDSDVDAFDAGGRIEYGIARGWTAESAFYGGWNTFPERIIGQYLQTDTATEFGAGVARGLGRGRRVRLNLSYLNNASNASISRYGAWRGQLLAQTTAWGLMDVTARVTHERRNYDEEPSSAAAPAGLSHIDYRARTAVHQARTAAQAAALPSRTDHFTQLSINLGRQLTPRIRSFVKMGHINYRSTADGYSFTEANASAGLELTLGLAPEGAGGWNVIDEPRLDTLDLAPRIHGREVRFRHYAPGARTVAVIGNFNDWQSPGVAMAATGRDDVWEVRLVLPPGLYRYMFLVDGTVWQRPVQAPMYEADGFGFDNGVVEIAE